MTAADLRFVLERAWNDDVPNGTIALKLLTWNDWWEFRTAYMARYVDSNGASHTLGEVKIADVRHEYRDEKGAETPLPADVFSELDAANFVSLGQSEGYYQRVRDLFGAQTQNVLRRLGDLAADPNKVDQFSSHRVVANSLMRGVAGATIRNKFHRIVLGSDSNEGYSFSYVRPAPEGAPFPDGVIKFEVRPDSYPPTNVHALTGRNGSGKTTLLRSMAKTMLGSGIWKESDGKFLTDSGGPVDIANLVYVSFSAFDVMPLPVLDKELQWNVPYSYVGLQFPVDHPAETQGMEQPEDLTRTRATRPADALESSFAESAAHVLRKELGPTWERALRTLEADPNFSEAEVSKLADSTLNEERILFEAKQIWNKLSTGHKIVLLTITRLVESVIERTLVLIDEPEGHLHPPLLSALVRALSDLLKEKNGVAVVATHSPVVLQEIPRSCTTKVRRVGLAQAFERPTVETFGESVGVLTSEVFSLEVSDSGFHKMLTDSALELGSYEAVLTRFDNQLGFEGRAILSSWFAAQVSS